MPGQTDADLEADLAQLLAIDPEHVSLYALTYKEGTPFIAARWRGTLTPATEDIECRMMRRIEEVLTQAGYEHYEVSNYAKPGRRARHNSLYWQGAMYLGLGPGAHSFMHRDWQAGTRWENTRQPAAYMAAWPSPANASGPPREGDAAVNMAETLTPKQLLAERMLCGLRQTDGVPLDEPVCRPHAQQVAQAAPSRCAPRLGRARRHDVASHGLGARTCRCSGGAVFLESPKLESRTGRRAWPARPRSWGSLAHSPRLAQQPHFCLHVVRRASMRSDASIVFNRF